MSFALDISASTRSAPARSSFAGAVGLLRFPDLLTRLMA